MSCALSLACGDGTRDSASSTYACIVGGGSGAALKLTEPQINAVVQISVWSRLNLSSPVGLCAGTLLDPTWVLTANHCAHADDVRLTLALGSAEAPACGPNAVVLERRYSKRFIRHPALDALLIELDSAVSQVRFTSSLLAQRDGLEVNGPVVIGGFGKTAAGDVGRLTFASSSVAALEADRVDVRAAQMAGPCVGDSGGPLLSHPDSSGVKLLGVLSEGDPSCVGQDRYVRASALIDWIDGAAPDLLSPRAK